MNSNRIVTALGLATLCLTLSTACLWPSAAAAPESNADITQTWAALSAFSQQETDEPSNIHEDSQADEQMEPTATPTPGPPMISVSVDTNCRSGPGLIYEFLGALMTYEEAEVLASSSLPGFWVIENPDNPGNECWVGEQYASIQGDTSSLPVRTPPPSPTPEVSEDALGSISGYVFIDGNNNGQPGDPQDGVLTGAMVALYEGPCPSLNKIRIVPTNNQGFYIFDDLPSDHYCVIRPNTAPLTSPDYYYIELDPGENLQGINFRFVP